MGLEGIFLLSQYMLLLPKVLGDSCNAIFSFLEFGFLSSELELLICSPLHSNLEINLCLAKYLYRLSMLELLYVEFRHISRHFDIVELTARISINFLTETIAANTCGYWPLRQ